MGEALVEYDYDAVNPDELSIKVGDTIQNINVIEGGWWEGEINGKRGMFPDNFVKLKDDSNKSPSTVPTPSVNGQRPVEEVIKRENSTLKKKMRAKVTYSYAPQNEDELPLEVDSEIEITSQPEPGWWEGLVNGKKGMFPSNFVEILTADDEKADEAKLVRPKPMPKGPGFGDIFKNMGTPRLKPVVHPSPKSSEAPSKADTSKSNSIIRDPTPAAEPSKFLPRSDSTSDSGVKEKAVVEFDYDPKNPDELQLKKGTTINIVSKDVGDLGWWKGEKDGKVGVFPDNFVKLVDQEAKAKPPVRPGHGPKGKTEEWKPPVGAKAVLPGYPRVKTRPAPEPKPKPSSTQDESSGNVFGDIKPSTNKLSHLTKDRPKVDNKRPPSNHGLISENSPTAASTNPQNDVTAAPEASKLPPWSREFKARSVRRHPTFSPENGEQPNESSAPVPASKSPTVSSLKTTNAGSKGGTAASSQATNELQNEMKALRTEMANLKKELKKEIDNVVQELDEEKKLRMSMQVELDRVKRMLKH